MVICKFVAGGAETTALELVRALEGRGHEFTVVSVQRGGVLGAAFTQAAARVYEGVAKFRRDPLGLWRVARIIRRHRIELVLCVSTARDAMFYSFLSPAAALRRLPRICWCTSRPGGQAGRFVKALRRYRRLGLLNAIVCISRLQRRMMVDRGLGRRHLPLIRNGVDIERIALAAPTTLPLPAGKRIIVQVANITPDKDYATLITAAGLLRQRRDDFHLVLVGRGTDSPEICQAVRDAGLSGGGDAGNATDRKEVPVKKESPPASYESFLNPAVTLAGHRDDVPGILAAADLFVLATRGEVSSIAVQESFGAGVAVIVSDIPAFDEMLTDGCEGLRVAPGDPQALADAIGRLLDDGELCAELAARARRRVRQFTQDRMAACFDRLFHCVARESGR